MKQTFYFYMKSHFEYPDVEDEVEADNKEEAAWIFANKYELDLETARRNTVSAKELGI